MWRALEDHLDACGKLPREPDGSGGVSSSEVVLANWVRYQRRRRAQGTLPMWQEDILNQLRGFSWDPHGDAWRQNYAALQLFLEAQGRMPRYRANDRFERQLAAWVHKQRHLNRRSQLRLDRVAALRRLPFRIV